MRCTGHLYQEQLDEMKSFTKQLLRNAFEASSINFTVSLIKDTSCIDRDVDGRICGRKGRARALFLPCWRFKNARMSHGHRDTVVSID